MDISSFEKKIGYFFKNRELLQTAFTHTSYANEKNLKSYERLEYLGDAIVDFLVGEYLFKNYPQMNEGLMSRIRAALVCEKTLSELALSIGIEKYILLGKGAEQSGDRKRASILSDVFEAHIAAMYLDRGIDGTRSYLLDVYGSIIDKTVKDGDFVDYKTMFQEAVQENGTCKIEYRLVSAEGPVHNCKFTMELLLDGKVMGTGVAMSKKDAQQKAAFNALAKIKY